MDIDLVYQQLQKLSKKNAGNQELYDSTEAMREEVDALLKSKKYKQALQLMIAIDTNMLNMLNDATQLVATLVKLSLPVSHTSHNSETIH